MTPPTSPATVLLIDDDRELCAMVTEYLGGHELRVVCATDGPAGLQCALANPPDLIILDVMLPRVDGFAVLRSLRRQSVVPVIMLTARAEPDDRIRGLEHGADDYLVKPFTPGELLARVRAVLRRVRGVSRPSVAVGRLYLDPAAREVRVDGVRCALTAMEFDVLELLMLKAGLIVSRDEIARTLFGRETTAYERSLEVHVSNLRKKLGPVGAEIQTVRGTGYQLRRP